jgi:hypothetical protein
MMKMELDMREKEAAAACCTVVDYCRRRAAAHTATASYSVVAVW